MYALIHIPKTAGTTMRAILRNSFGAQHLDIRASLKNRASKKWISAEDLKKAQRVYPNLAGICGHRVTPFNGLEKYYPEIRYFTFLRNPLRRFVSDFLGSHSGRLEHISPYDLEQFCNNPTTRNMHTRMLCGSDDPEAAIRVMEKKVGFVGITERFDESFVMFRTWLGSDKLKDGYKRKRIGKGTISWPILEDPEWHARVKEANAADLKVYHYATEIIFPRQIAAYGPDLERDVNDFCRRNAEFVEPHETLWGKTKRNCVYKPLLHLGFI